MTESESRRIGVSIELKPHAYDPAAQPELFDGVLARRLIAFVIDLVIIAVPLLIFSVFVFVSGFFTFFISWLLFWLMSPIAVIWALAYYGFTLGSPASATVGMRVMDLEMRTWYGSPCYFVLGAVHAIGYWISVSFLTPFVLLVGLFNARRRLLHDILLGIVVINNELRAASLRKSRGPL